MRYFIGFLVTIGLIIILIVLIFSGGGGSKKKPTSSVPTSTSQLAAFASTDVTARFTSDGPIVANQDHRASQITVGQNQVTYTQIQGYEGTVVNQQTFANNQNAYNNFLYAIGRAGFLRGNPSSALANEKGYCSTGSRYIFELIQNGHDLQRYWSTSCGSGPSTYQGNLSLTLTLFKAQVPNISSLSQNN